LYKSRKILVQGRKFPAIRRLSAPAEANAPRATAFGLATASLISLLIWPGRRQQITGASPWSLAYIAGLAARLP
jgi:hypothetical protein